MPLREALMILFRRVDVTQCRPTCAVRLLCYMKKTSPAYSAVMPLRDQNYCISPLL